MSRDVLCLTADEFCIGMACATTKSLRSVRYRLLRCGGSTIIYKAGATVFEMKRRIRLNDECNCRIQLQSSQQYVIIKRRKALLVSVGALLVCISLLFQVTSMFSNGNLKGEVYDSSMSKGVVKSQDVRDYHPKIFPLRSRPFAEENITSRYRDTFKMSKYVPSRSLHEKIELVRQRYVKLGKEVIGKYIQRKYVTNSSSIVVTVNTEHHANVDEKKLVGELLVMNAIEVSTVADAVVSEPEKRMFAAVEDIPSYHVPNINCGALFAGDTAEKTKAYVRHQTNPKSSIDSSLYLSKASNCAHFIVDRQYIMRPLSDEEASFSIAYSILVFRDIEQFERLLRSIYRPQNFYCIHVDKKSQDTFYQAVEKIGSCFGNVFVTKRRVNVQWGTFSVIEPELICMNKLLRLSKRWRYFINLTGQEFPLKTNWDLVKILSTFNGSNNMEGTVARRDNRRFVNKRPPPLNIRLTKGSVHIVASRKFVKFLLFSNASQLFREWVKDIDFPDETYFTSLNHNPHLGTPGAYLGEPETDLYRYRFVTRFKNWGDGPFNWPCHGQRVRNVCIFGIGDLPLLASRPELFANKFYIDFEPLTLECIEELHYNRTRNELTGKSAFNVSFYQQLSFVSNHQ